MKYAFFQVPSGLFLFASSLTRGDFRMLPTLAGTKMPRTSSSLSLPKEFSRTAVILRLSQSS